MRGLLLSRMRIPQRNAPRVLDGRRGSERRPSYVDLPDNDPMVEADPEPTDRVD